MPDSTEPCSDLRHIAFTPRQRQSGVRTEGIYCAAAATGTGFTWTVTPFISPLTISACDASAYVRVGFWSPLRE